MQQTFTDFKNNFYKRVDDVSLFDCGEINLLKVVLDGLKVKYTSKGKVNSYIFYPLWLYRLYCFIKRKKTTNTLDNLVDRNKVFLISDNGRTILDQKGDNISLYFNNIICDLGRENCLIVMENNSLCKDYDYTYKELEAYYSYFPLSKEDALFRKNLISCYKKIAKSKVFLPNELADIKFAFHKFFIQYKVWNSFIINFNKINKAFFVCHYHKEGEILALKNNNIFSIELQHGLIAPQDIFYVFPDKINSFKDRMLFADKMLVYGEYWKQVLLKGYEYSDYQIAVIGYYLADFNINYKEEVNKLKNEFENSKVILITTQTFLHEHFIELAQRIESELIKRNKNYIIILKPHPAERIELYQNYFNKSKYVKILMIPLPILFSVANIHVSIYSTTLYDALRHNLNNYTYKVKECEDYVNEIIKSGIAKELIDYDEFFDSIDNFNSFSFNYVDFFEKYNANQCY
jgi:hypothetical protein